MSCKLLFLDDDDVRIKYFREEIKNYTTPTIVKTAQACIKKLEEQDWDLVCLDHDLGGQVFQNSGSEYTGMEVVRWIERNRPKVKIFIIHSWNPSAAPIMKDRLRSHYTTYRYEFGPTMITRTKELIDYLN